MTDETDDESIPLEEAMHLAALWSAGKLIGGDPYEVVNALYLEILRLRALPNTGPSHD